MRPVIQIVNESYKHPQSVYFVTRYVTHNKDGSWLQFCGSPNTSMRDIEGQMMCVKRYFGKMSGRQVRHFFISFDNESGLIPPDLDRIGMNVCYYYSDRYQIVYGVHEDTDHLHIHFAMNTVSYVDGSMYSSGYEDSYRLTNYVTDVLKKYNKDIDDLESMPSFIYNDGSLSDDPVQLYQNMPI